MVVGLSDSHTVTGKLLRIKNFFSYDSRSTWIVSLLAKTAAESIPSDRTSSHAFRELLTTFGCAACAKVALALSVVVVTGQMMYMMINYKLEFIATIMILHTK